MKNLLYGMLLLFPLSLMSCKEDEDTATDEVVAVTYYTISGTWELVEYCGNPLPEEAFMTLCFDRKEHTVQMTGNLDSAYPVTRTSTFEIDGDDYYGYTLTGSYGAVAGDWQYSYKVKIYTDDTMLWTAVEDPACTQRFRLLTSL